MSGNVALCYLWVAFVLVSCSAPSGTSINVSTDGQNIGGGLTYPLSSNVDLTVTGGGNTVTGAWHTGVQITFRDAPPAYVVRAIQEANGVKAKDGHVWVIADADGKDPKVQRAIGASIGIPGTIIKGFTK